VPRVDPSQALADLTEVSSQIQAAVVIGSAGEVLASTLEADPAERLAAAAEELVGAMTQAPGGGTGELVQFEAATADGSVFGVRDGGRLIVATTATEPTAGLVFYDLKSCLRAIAQPAGKPRPKKKTPEPEPAADGQESGPDAA
jgi:predicted regulator of Ras-like GTPase activity (Roadblock/LC7/MglB family)